MLVKNLCSSAFLSNKALIGDTRLNTNLKITDNKNKSITVGKINSNPLNKVSMKKAFDQNLLKGILVLGRSDEDFFIY